MGFWHNFDVAGGVGLEFLPLLVAEVALALFLAAIRPSARSRLRAATMMLLVSMLASFTGALSITLFPTVTGSVAIEVISTFSQVIFLTGSILIWAILLFRVALPPLNLAPAPILRDTLLALVYIAATIILLGRHGVNLSGIIATSAVLTGVIGFSLQDTLGNVMAGVSLQLERTIVDGDYIKIDGLEGRVLETTWRHTTIETADWDTIVIPNSTMTKSTVTVYGRTATGGKTHRVSLPFAVSISDAPDIVIDVLQRAFRDHSIANVASIPAPFCVLKELKDAACTYVFYYHIIDPMKAPLTTSDIQRRICNALMRAGLEISVPSSYINMSIASRTPKVDLPQQEMSARLDAIDRAKILSPLNADEKADLAGKLDRAPFSKGDIISYQGEEADCLYILVKGDADVRVSDDKDISKYVATLHQGDVFGEMGMMLGQPRSATVIATTDVSCYRLNKEDFKTTLTHRPELADALSVLLAKRQLELDEVVSDPSMTSTVKETETQLDILQHIKAFFFLR